jgi:aryl-alcohol dehydrogenase-like predicted oxidoreductase
LVATKFGNTIDEERRQLTGVDVSPAYVRQAVAASLRRLGRDYVDLYQVHTPDMSTAQADDVIVTLEDLVQDGVIRWWGVSTDDPVQAELFAPAPHCTAMQIELNVFNGNRPMLDICDRYDLAALCRSPLAMGLLGGRYSASSRLPVDDVRGRQPGWLRWFDAGRPDPAFLARLGRVREALTCDGRSLPQGALGWILAHHARAIPLPGFRSPDQVRENTDVLRLGALPESAHSRVEQALGHEALK